MAKVIGKVAQIMGPVIDVSFSSDGELPKIYDSLEISRTDGSTLVLEVQQHIGEDIVRCVAMDSTDGLSRGREVVAMGAQIQMPVGKEVFGRLFNVIGDAIDGIGNLFGRHSDGQLACHLFSVGKSHCLLGYDEFAQFLNRQETGIIRGRRGVHCHF